MFTDLLSTHGLQEYSKEMCKLNSSSLTPVKSEMVNLIAGAIREWHSGWKSYIWPCCGKQFPLSDLFGGLYCEKHEMWRWGSAGVTVYLNLRGSWQLHEACITSLWWETPGVSGARAHKLDFAVMVHNNSVIQMVNVCYCVLLTSSLWDPQW